MNRWEGAKADRGAVEMPREVLSVATELVLMTAGKAPGDLSFGKVTSIGTGRAAMHPQSAFEQLDDGGAESSGQHE
jgi:hypothetical protein